MIILLAAPIATVIMIHGIRSRISNLEGTMADLRMKIISLDDVIRHGSASTCDFSNAPAASPIPQYRDGGQASPGDGHETVESADTSPVDQLIPDEIELAEEKSQEAPDFAGALCRPQWEPEGNAAPLAEPMPNPAKGSWLTARCKEFFAWLFAEGNIWVTVGVMLFLAGFGLLFSYVHKMGLISLELRLTGATIAGIAMTAFGWRLRESRRTYALILQGGGIGALYIVLVAGAKLGSVIPVEGAILGMILLSAFTIVLAVLQEFEPLALFALLGGYAAPILVSAGSQNFAALFSIHSLLNFEVFLISLFRDWRKTRWGGLTASCAIGAAWGALRWRPEYLASVEPFLVLLFINYSALSMIPFYSRRLENIFKNVKFWQYERIDTPMTATIPFVFVFLQMAAASHTAYGVAVTCLAVGACYLALERITTKSGLAGRIGFPHRLFLVYCIIFSNLAIPFIFRQASASAIWAVEGAFLIAFAAKKERGDVLVCGLLLHLTAFILYNCGPYLNPPSHMYGASVRPVGLLNWRDRTSPFLLTGLIFAASSLISSYFTCMAPAGLSPAMRFRGRTFRFPRTGSLSSFFALYAAIWWTLSVWHAALVTFAGSRMTAFSILCLGGAAGYILSSYPGWRTGGFSRVPPTVEGGIAPSPAFSWNAAKVLAFPPLAVAFAWALMSVGSAGVQPYKLWGPILREFWGSYTLNWTAFAAMFALGAASYRSFIPTRLHIVTWGVSLFAFVSYTAEVWRVWANSVFPSASGTLGAVGDFAAFLPVFTAAALLTPKRFERTVALERYRWSSFTVLCALMLFLFPAFVRSFRVTWHTPPFYVPLLNKLELRQFLYLAAAAMLSLMIPNKRARKITLLYALGFAVFLWLNNVAARAALRCFNESVAWEHMSRALYFQGIIAILWGIASLACIFGGKMHGYRPLWFIGAGLLVLDILKLLMIDLRNSATIIRIFAFLLLGGFFLFIGWAAPLPPTDAQRKKHVEEDEA
jgi:uncharacterized membrane protein